MHALDPPAAAAELPLALGMGFGCVGLGHAAGYRQRQEQQALEAPRHRWWSDRDENLWAVIVDWDTSEVRSARFVCFQSMSNSIDWRAAGRPQIRQHHH